MISVEIASLLPEGILTKQVTQIIRLGSNIAGEHGETLLLLHGEELIVLTRKWGTETFSVLPLAAGILPFLEETNQQSLLRFKCADGAAGTVEVAAHDRPAVEELMRAIRCPTVPEGGNAREHGTEIEASTVIHPPEVAKDKTNPADRHAKLLALIESYTEARQWTELVEALIQFAAVEGTSGLKSKLYYSAAVVCRDELKDIDRSLVLFNLALDENPERLKAFEAIDQLCNKRKDWSNLELNYRMMIKRLPQEGQNELKVMLWHSLGEIYRTRLNDCKSATASFEVAAGIEPGNPQRNEILAELYQVMGPDHAPEAIAQHQLLIQHSPFRIDSYKALKTIYMDLQQYDKAWCLCSTLAFLNKADPEEQQFYEQHKQHKQRGFVRAKAQMTDELWSRHVFHPDEDHYIGAIFASITNVVAKITARPHKQFGLKREERRDLAHDQLHFSKVFSYVASVLNVVQPELYLQPEQPTGLRFAHTVEIPSFVVGQDLLQGRPEKELAFAIAKQLSYLGPEHLLRSMLPAPSQLRTVFFAALRMANPNFAIPPADLPEVEKFQKTMSGQMHPAQLEPLTIIVRKLASRKSEVNLDKWWTAVELTANRVGFILCNDLETAAKMVSTEPSEVGSKPPKERVMDLVLFSISEEYFAVRSALGFSICPE